MLVMRRPVRYAILALALTILAAFSWKVGHTQSDAAEYFPQTRHFVEGAFLTFYRGTPNPELIYGYPITEAFTDRDGLRVQYFQRARLERLPDGSVARTALGRELYEPGRAVVDQDTRSAACRTFPTGHAVCSDFLRFFETHGGSGRFGQPISGVEMDGLRHVQYFEYTRLEWVPETDLPGLDIQIGSLGWLYFNHRQENQALLRPPQNPNILEVTGLQAYAFTAAASVPAGGSQVVYVVVQDDTHTALPNADVQLTVSLAPDRQIFLQGTTNIHGYASFPVVLESGERSTGIVSVAASAEYAGLSADTRTSFRIGH